MTRKKPRRKYFPNNLNQVNNINPDDLDPVPFDAVLQRTDAWHLHPKVFMVARITNKRTGGVSEVGFLDQVTANRIIKKIMQSGNYHVFAVTETHSYELETQEPSVE